MGLMEAIRKNKTFYGVDYLAKLLADSGCDLGDEERVMDVLVAHGIKPYQVYGNIIETILDARIEAHNLKTMRLLHERALPFTKLHNKPVDYGQ